MDIEIPECMDDDWMREMFRELKSRLETIETKITDFDLEEIIECYQIIDALQEYAGY